MGKLTKHRNNDMTRWHTDNLLTHICAAALLVDGFEVDVNDLRNDLKLENKECVPSLLHTTPPSLFLFPFANTKPFL